MRIKQISVTNLFGIFDHVIPMNMDERVTLIHGPNGFGKTILLKMINGFFTEDYSLFRSVPFNDFGMEFDNKSSLVVKKPASNQKKDKPFKMELKDARGHKSSYEPRARYIEQRGLPFPMAFIEEAFPELRRIGSRRWQDTRTGEVLGQEELADRFDYVLDRGRDKIPPKKIRALQEQFNVRFLDAERLLTPQQEGREKSRVKRTVSEYSKELATTIGSTLARYGTLSQSLDRSFPRRLVQEGGPSSIDNEALRTKLNQLEEKRLRLVEAGLLEREKTDFQIPREIKDDTKLVLSVYVEDVGAKLAVLDEIAEKLDLIKSIINQRFLYKNLTIDKDRGFVFTTSSGEPLSPTDLSSGEQHELVLLYELLFKSKRDSLFLIDEPELSLHVKWQTQFLRDLQNIAKLGAFDVLLATHSPEIITDRWDLTVELKGPD